MKKENGLPFGQIVSKDVATERRCGPAGAGGERFEDKKVLILKFGFNIFRLK